MATTNGIYRDVDVTLKLDRYIAHPNWPETETVVNVLKKSGATRARSEDAATEKLHSYLARIGMTREEYEAAVILSKREWHRTADGFIFIPRHSLSGCLREAAQRPPAGAKIARESVSWLARIGDFVTDRKDASGVWERFAQPKDPKSGKPLSNQRSLRRNEYIEGATATGVIQLHNEVKVETLAMLLKHAGSMIGVGASRVMGYGRFLVEHCE